MMADKVWKNGVAARRRFFAILEKPQAVFNPPPPAGRGLSYDIVLEVMSQPI